MKLTNHLRKLKSRFPVNRLSNALNHPSLLSFGLFALTACVIWLGGPYLEWQGQAPFAAPEKRLYVIIALSLLWVLKILMLDFDNASPLQHNDETISNKCQELQQRFAGALQFLKKTTFSALGETKSLNQLPWYLLIGPIEAGKTALLANAGIQYILQRRLSPEDSSESCDWWVTRDACIIDVPGCYILQEETPERSPAFSQTLWRFFLDLIKKHRGKQGINGIILALPLPEIMKQNDNKAYQRLLANVLKRIHDIQERFPYPIPCQLIITKCDILPGFTEFFAEAANEEITQAWGITLPLKNNQKTIGLFAQQFDALIKKLNQQLLFRLHQERNPMVRPAIKDFPLQLERLKELTLDFIKKIDTARLSLKLHGMYLTSALQQIPEVTVLDEAINTSQRAVQLFHQPAPTARAYFIKQLLMQGVVQMQHPTIHQKDNTAFARRLTYALAVTAVIAVAVLLGRDFEQGIKHTYRIQSQLADYRIAIQQANDLDEQLLHTLNFLNSLQDTTKQAEFTFDVRHLLAFYSYRSQQKASELYVRTLQTVLLPEIKTYLGDYLTLPINKNSDFVYAALKAYLMLGDPTHFESEFVTTTIKEILNHKMSPDNIKQLMQHVRLALKSNKVALPLDMALVDQTRKYFTALPNFQLSYIILKNVNGNNSQVDINLGIGSSNTPVFVSRKTTNTILAMFTAKTFSTIMSQDTMLSASETLIGNWVLGDRFGNTQNANLIPALVEELRAAYVNDYVEVWQRLVNNIYLAAPKNLTQIDLIIINLISSDSPLLQLLQTLYDNTYFDPIRSASPDLQRLGALLDKRGESENLLFQVFASLQSLHVYLQGILTADNEKKAAFEAVSKRMQNLTEGKPDILTQLHLVAEKSPEPIKSWLDKIANDAWHLLMQDAAHYLDTSWSQQVIQFYKSDIADRYPFSSHATKEVDIDKFVAFFGNPGIVLNFYNQYLQNLVDTSKPDWHWKAIDNKKIPFSDETLRQIQHAMRIHQSFFPNNDNKLFVQFALQPYQFSKQLRRVKLNINDKQFVDDSFQGKQKDNNLKNPHLIAWPSQHELKFTSYQLMTDKHTLSRDYPGIWGWFKLVNDSFESALSKKEIVLNLAMNDNSARYLLLANGKMNPFLSLNMRHFLLPAQLSEKKK